MFTFLGPRKKGNIAAKTLIVAKTLLPGGCFPVFAYTMTSPFNHFLRKQTKHVSEQFFRNILFPQQMLLAVAKGEAFLRPYITTDIDQRQVIDWKNQRQVIDGKNIVFLRDLLIRDHIVDFYVNFAANLVSDCLLDKPFTLVEAQRASRNEHGARVTFGRRLVRDAFFFSSSFAALFVLNCPASSVLVFRAQLVEHCSANAEATGSNPVEAPKNVSLGYFAIA